MIAAYHMIWSAYGWWLPNDPRGSGSQTIREDILTELGELHLGRKKIQPAGREIRAFYIRRAHMLGIRIAAHNFHVAADARGCDALWKSD